MGLNLILLIIGLVICFGGIYFRRVISGILGLVCGCLGAFAFAFVAAGVWRLGDNSTMMAILICGLIFAIVSAIHYKAVAAISSFSSTFMFVVLFLAISGEMDSDFGIILIAVMIASVTAVISVKFYDYSFVITSALIGAFIASVGGFGLLRGYGLEDILFVIVWNGFDLLNLIFISTILLTIVGCIVQLKRLRALNAGNEKTSKKTGFNSEQINNTVATVSEQAKKLGQATAPLFQDISNQAKDIWRDANTADGREALKKEIAKEKLLFIPPLVAFFIFPLLEAFALDNGLYSFFRATSWLHTIASAIPLGTFVYFILKKNRRFVFFHMLLYMCGCLFDILLAVFSFRHSVFYMLINTFGYFIIWVVLDFISKNIKREEMKPIILALVAVTLDIFIIKWFAMLHIYFFFTFSTFAAFCVTLGTVYFLFKKRDNVSIVGFNGVQEKHAEVDSSSPAHESYSSSGTAPSAAPSTPLSIENSSQLKYEFCPSCGAKLTSNDPFCGTCGKRVEL